MFSLAFRAPEVGDPALASGKKTITRISLPDVSCFSGFELGRKSEFF